MNDLEKKIELYLNQEMTPVQLAAFEEKTKNDPQLQKDIITYQEMHTIYNDVDWKTADTDTKSQRVTAYETFLKSEKGKAISGSIKNAENQYFQTQSQSKVKQWILYGASIAAVLVIAFFAISPFNTEIDNQNLYAEYKNWNDLPSLTLRDQNNDLASAENFFRQKQYTEALNLFNTYQSKHVKQLNPQVLMYIGSAQLELEQHLDAIKTFKQLLHSNSLDAPKAHWYLTLAYLKTDNLNKAREALNVILTNTKNYKYQEAKTLMNQLE